MSQTRVTVGNRNQDPAYLVMTNGVVVMVSSETWLWAIGMRTETLYSWLSKKRIPYHSFGFRPRSSDDFIVKSGAHVPTPAKSEIIR